MNKYKNIIFDFDGTLADTYPFIDKLVREIAPKFGINNVTPEMLSEAKNLSVEEVLEKYDVSKLNFIKFSFIYRQKLNSEIGDIPYFDGIKETIQELNNRGYRMGVITSNSKRNVRKFLKTHGMKDSFEFVANRIFFFAKYKTIQKWIKKKGWKKEETVYVGDEIRDVIEAKKAGISVISATWGFNDKTGLVAAKPDEVIDDVSQLLLIL